MLGRCAVVDRSDVVLCQMLRNGWKTPTVRFAETELDCYVESMPKHVGKIGAQINSEKEKYNYYGLIDWLLEAPTDKASTALSDASG